MVALARHTKAERVKDELAENCCSLPERADRVGVDRDKAVGGQWAGSGHAPAPTAARGHHTGRPRSQRWPVSPPGSPVSGVAAVPGPSVCPEGLGWRGQLTAGSWPPGLGQGRGQVRLWELCSACQVLPGLGSLGHPLRVGWGCRTPRQRLLAQVTTSPGALGVGHVSHTLSSQGDCPGAPGLSGLSGPCPVTRVRVSVAWGLGPGE